jgi:hypothetical protein
MNLCYHVVPVRNIQKGSCRNCTILCPIGATGVGGVTATKPKCLKACKNQNGAKINWHRFSLGSIRYAPLLNLKRLSQHEKPCQNLLWCSFYQLCADVWYYGADWLRTASSCEPRATSLTAFAADTSWCRQERLRQVQPRKAG